jgi:hypothetical protein
MFEEDRAAIFMSEISSSPVSKDNFVIEKEIVPSIERKRERNYLRVIRHSRNTGPRAFCL